MIRITENQIDPEQELRAFREGLVGVGAISSFVGMVRDDGKTEMLTLSHYPGFTEKQIKLFSDEAEKRWPLEDCLIIHRVGRMAVGDPIVVIVTASLHRRAAIDSCDFIMDKLKCEAPFWKQETANERTTWVEPRSEDFKDLNRWS